MIAVGRQAPSQAQVHQLIITLRKALALQKQFEEDCQRHHLPIEYRWSLNNLTTEKELADAVLGLQKE